MKSIQAQSIGLIAAMLFAYGAGAQEKAPAAAVAQQALPSAGGGQTSSSAPDAPKKKRVAKRAPKPSCTKLDDPWDNLCDVQKKAALACQDLPEAKKVAKRTRKGDAQAAPPVSQRQQCIDSYMRNV